MLDAYIQEFSSLPQFRRWVSQSFENLSELNKVREHEYERLSVENTLRHDKDWFGETTYDELSRGITEYKSPELIDDMFNRIDHNISAQTRDKIKTRKLRFNNLGVGVFVFDRAAMGLFRLKEYYSSKHKKAFDKVDIYSVGNSYRLKMDDSPLTERWEQRADGKRKVRTTNKSVFAWFPSREREKPAIELYIGCGANGAVTAEQLLYSGMSAIVVAKLLDKANIPTKIVAALGSSPDNFEESAYASLVTLKNYEERLDINLIALVTSDPRFFRYDGFKGYVAIYDHFNTPIPSGYGTGMSNSTLRKTIEESNFSFNLHPLSTRYYFGRIFNEDEVIKHIESTIDDIAQKIQTSK